MSCILKKLALHMNRKKKVMWWPVYLLTSVEVPIAIASCKCNASEATDVNVPPPVSNMLPWSLPLIISQNCDNTNTQNGCVQWNICTPFGEFYAFWKYRIQVLLGRCLVIGEYCQWVYSPTYSYPSARSRRESFGSTFAGSSGTGGNGGGNGNVGSTGPVQRMTTTSTFNIEIKPKEPPIFRGTANEDVDTWLAKVSDFIYLTEANTRQQVAYMATLLQDAAADWWAALIKERGGSRPVDFGEMSALMQKRFGSTTRVDRARAALRNVRQMQNETVRSYGTRFEALLAKLPSFDMEWAKSQFIWGLNQRIAELVVLAEPADLSIAIQKAEKIEMARGTVSHPNLCSRLDHGPEAAEDGIPEDVDVLVQCSRLQDQCSINLVKYESNQCSFSTAIWTIRSKAQS